MHISRGWQSKSYMLDSYIGIKLYNAPLMSNKSALHEIEYIESSPLIEFQISYQTQNSPHPCPAVYLDVYMQVPIRQQSYLYSQNKTAHLLGNSRLYYMNA